MGQPTDDVTVTGLLTTLINSLEMTLESEDGINLAEAVLKVSDALEQIAESLKLIADNVEKVAYAPALGPRH